MTTQQMYGFSEPLGFFDSYDCGGGDVMFRIYSKDGSYAASRCVSSEQAKIDQDAYPMVGYFPRQSA